MKGKGKKGNFTCDSNENRRQQAKQSSQGKRKAIKTTLNPFPYSRISYTRLKFIHLMLDDVDEWVESRIQCRQSKELCLLFSSFESSHAFGKPKKDFSRLQKRKYEKFSFKIFFALFHHQICEE